MSTFTPTQRIKISPKYMITPTKSMKFSPKLQIYPSSREDYLNKQKIGNLIQTCKPTDKIVKLST